MDRIGELRRAGVSIWVDSLSRDVLENGQFERWVNEDGVTGATSNPTIFAAALASESNRYDDEVRAATMAGRRDPKALFVELAISDVGRAADLLRPTYQGSGGNDGFVSIECTPDLADDTEATVAQGMDLWGRLNRPNVMIKVPATAAGVPAVAELTARGVNVNVTLLFSLGRYGQVVDAFVEGVERRLAEGGNVEGIRSVASFFVSRIDTQVDERLPESSPLRGRVAVANAKLAYQMYSTRFADKRWQPLARAEARPQRLLWASTGTKNPAYSDVVYVEELVGRDVINTMPPKTLAAFADHGTAKRTLDRDLDAARGVLDGLSGQGIDLNSVTAALEHEGVASFCSSYRELLGTIEREIARVAGRPPT